MLASSRTWRLVGSTLRAVSAQQYRPMSTGVPSDQDVSPGLAQRKRELAFAAISAFVGAAAFYASISRGFSPQAAYFEQAAFFEEASKPALNPDYWIPFKLQGTEKITHNTKLFRFLFDDPDAKSGLNVASCLLTRAPTGGLGKDGNTEFVIRPYTPTTSPDVKGYFDLVVKIYPDGKMTQHFAQLKPGDTLEVKGPIPKLPYTPNMKKQIGMIAGGTGITPMLQIIDAILSNPSDLTQVSLLYANISPDDILLKDKLDELAVSHPNFKVYYVVSNPSENWKGGVGYLSYDAVIKGLPAPSDNTLILVCGPPGMMNAVSGDKTSPKSQGELKGLLKQAGYSPNQVFKF